MLAAHQETIRSIQKQIKKIYNSRNGQASDKKISPVSLSYESRSSFTIRSKSYKKGGEKIDCSQLNKVIFLDKHEKIVKVQPRISMESLVQATLPYCLIPAVMPELKRITVGGAIMGMAAESGSHLYGCFNDICSSFDLIQADGELITASSENFPDIFYGVPGCYGSLGMLSSIDIKLIPAKSGVHLRYHVFQNPFLAVEALIAKSKSEDPPDFIDGIILEKNLAVVIEGCLKTKKELSGSLPKFSTKPLSSQFYWQHVQEIAKNNLSKPYEELMAHDDYFFRYDLGAFWMGNYLFHPSLLAKLVGEGIFKMTSSDSLEESEVANFSHLPNPNRFLRTMMRPLASGKHLAYLLHKAEKWVQDRFIIQDFCIPESNAFNFLEDILENPGLFPIWLLPIKGTRSAQIFAPHQLKNKDESHVVNFGLYGLPAHAVSVPQLTKRLEKRAWQLKGRKVLYSCSYYSLEEFWKIYPYSDYQALRKKTFAEGFWHGITEKVLSY